MKCHRSRLAHAIGSVLLFVALARATSHAEDDLAANPRVELAGTWHVLIHYRDSSTENPEAWRWDERIWIFEMRGDRLRWIEYPIVLFRDDSGRFETRGKQRNARVLDAWEPNDAQRAQIRAGLEVNPRGRNHKDLKGSDAAGWHSGDRLQASSTQTIGYVEAWSVEGLPGLPSFSQRDVMGSGGEDSLEGLTSYAAREIRAGGEQMTGEFTRDSARKGRFVMRRAGEVKSVGERSQKEIRKRLGAELPGSAPP
jgi:hypothetical protein